MSVKVLLESPTRGPHVVVPGAPLGGCHPAHKVGCSSRAEEHWKGAERRRCSSGGPREDEVNRTDIFLETKLISEAKAKIDLALFSSLPHPHLT